MYGAGVIIRFGQSVYPYIMKFLQTFDECLLQVIQPLCIFIKSFIYQLCRKGKPRDPGDIFRTGAKPPLLASAEDRGFYLNPVIHVKESHTYHAGVTATHPYSSVWWQWILDIRPILYYLEYGPNLATESSIGAWLNPLLAWGGLLAMLCMVYLAAAKRDKTALFILIGYLAQLVPWVFVSRVVFEYHYFPSSIFLVLALCHVFRQVELVSPDQKRVILCFAGVSVALFAAFYPAISGLTVPRWYDLKFLKWLGTWPY